MSFYYTTQSAICVRKRYKYMDHVCVACACAASLCNYASGPLVSSCELRGGQPGRTMIPKCPRTRSVKPVFKRQARRSNPCHCTACLPYRLTYFRSARIQWQATLAVRQRRRDATSIADPSTVSLFDLMAYRYTLIKSRLEHYSREYILSP